MKKRKSNRGPSRNTHIREMKSIGYYEAVLPTKFKIFFEEIWHILPSLHKGYNIARKREYALNIAHCLIETGLTNKVVADSRNNTNKDARTRKAVWDVFLKKDLCRICLGSESSGKITRYRATGKLLELRKLWKLKMLTNVNLKRNTDEIEPTRHALVVLYSGKIDWRGRTLPDEEQKKPISIKERVTQQVEWVKYNRPERAHTVSVEDGLDTFREIENRINKINKENISHSWIAHVISDLGNTIDFVPNVCLRQIHSGDFFRATRLYSWGGHQGQGMDKEQRKKIVIDGEPAAEIDSACHHIRLLYHYKQLDTKAELYKTKKVFKNFSSGKTSSQKKAAARDFVKTATNICLNTNNRISAIRAISKHLREHENRKFYNKLIWKIEDTDLNGILDRIIKSHPKKVSDCFFTDIGAELMTADGEIMLWTLNEFVTKRKKPALAIHDSLVIRASDVEEACDVFAESYQTFMMFKPVLRREF